MNKHLLPKQVRDKEIFIITPWKNGEGISLGYRSKTEEEFVNNLESCASRLHVPFSRTFDGVKNFLHVLVDINGFSIRSV